MPNTDMSAVTHPVQAGTNPPHPETLATDALCHMAAALSVLEMHADRTNRATVLAMRDLVSGYNAKADQAAANQSARELVGRVLPEISADLGYAIAAIERVNDDDTDDPILYAVSYLLKAARRFADDVPPTPLPP